MTKVESTCIMLNSARTEEHEAPYGIKKSLTKQYEMIPQHTQQLMIQK